jgi:hypothetical protein
MRRALFALPLVALAGCAGVGSSTLATGPAAPPAPGPVALFATRDPPGRELGLIEVHGLRPQVTLARLVEEFRRRAAELGGDAARLDAYATRTELVDVPHTWDCGTTEVETVTQMVTRVGPGGQVFTTPQTITVPKHRPRICRDVRRVEAAVLTLIGRAFRTPEAP